MKIFSVSSFIILVIASLVGAGQIGGGAGEFQVKLENHREKAAEPPIEAMLCPNYTLILPCNCGTWWYGYEIECSDSAVTQSSIETAIRETRKVNQVPEGRGMFINRFLIRETNLTELDLVPFYGNSMYYVAIQDNEKLTRLVTSGQSQDLGSIEVERFRILSSPMTREGFGDALSYFSNNMTEFIAYELSLGLGVGLEPGDGENVVEGEILPGLSTHTNLKDLQFVSSKISGRLEADTWIPKELINLQAVTLDGNNITYIGENVFDFVSLPEDEFFNIGLNVNELTENSFHPNSGISKSGRKTSLYLWYDQITTLPSQIFEPYLDAHVQNFLSLAGNPLICDERVSWLKSRRDELAQKVSSADCSNDFGHTVFTSGYVPVYK